MSCIPCGWRCQGTSLWSKRTVCESRKPRISHPGNLPEWSWHGEESWGKEQAIFILLPSRWESTGLMFEKRGSNILSHNWDENRLLFPSPPPPKMVFMEMSAFNSILGGLLKSREDHLFTNKLIQPLYIWRYRSQNKEWKKREIFNVKAFSIYFFFLQV